MQLYMGCLNKTTNLEIDIQPYLGHCVTTNFRNREANTIICILLINQFS